MNDGKQTGDTAHEGQRTPTSSGLGPAGNASEGDLCGTTRGGCLLVRKIAEGGMGQIYEAVQNKLSRKVAVKIIAPHLISRDEFLQRFEREAKIAAALNHPNVVQVYDFGEE